VVYSQIGGLKAIVYERFPSSCDYVGPYMELLELTLPQDGWRIELAMAQVATKSNLRGSAQLHRPKTDVFRLSFF